MPRIWPRRVALCSAFGQVFSDAGAVVKKVVLSNNFLFGSKLQYDTAGDTIHNVDADQTGWSALCDALPSSPLEELMAARSPRAGRQLQIDF